VPFARLHRKTDQGSSGRKRYAVPSGIASDSGYTHWPSFEPIRKNMVALCELYRENGYACAGFEPVEFLAQGENFAMVDIAWNIERVGQQPPWQFNTADNLMRTPDGWRVLLCTAYSEKKLNARPRI